MTRYTVLLLFILGFVPLKAQEITVINRLTTEPVENAAIFNQDFRTSTLSGIDGKVNLSDFDINDSITFQHPSFINITLSVSEARNKGIIKLDKKVILIPEFVITASKFRERKIDIAQQIDIINANALKLSTSQNSADLLLKSGNVFIQKSQGGGGSPILRGFEANKILLVVDGIRMNNSIYRSGHLQNSLTIDNAILDRVEVVYGPTSVIYGSDALGGTIHYLTRSPELADSMGINAGINAYTQVASANRSQKAHLDFNIANKYLGSLTSFTYSNFGDIRMGKQRSPFLNGFSECKHYSDFIANKDTMLVNSNPLIQRKTAYTQTDFLQKFVVKVSENNLFELNVQYSTSSDINRYDNLSKYTSDSSLKFAEWYYGPQNRFLSSVKHKLKSDNKFFTDVTTIFAYQHIEESRHSRYFNETDKLHQIEELNIFSGNIDFLKKFNPGTYLYYGFDSQFDKLNSQANSENIFTGASSPALTRYADDGSIYWNNSVFAAFKTELSDRINVSTGVRFNHTLVAFNYEDKISSLDTTRFNRTNKALTGTIGFVYKQSNYTRFLLNLATGYRNPNLDDISKLRAKGNDILLPNQQVKPEYTYNAELGFSHTFDGYIRLSGNYYISYLTNAIVRTKYYQTNGADTVEYNNRYYNAYINTNAEKALIHGTNVMLESDLNSNLSIKGSINYTYGEIISKGSPLAHIPPLYGRAEIKYKIKKFVYQFYAIYNGWKRMDKMAATGEDNEEYGTEYGFPSWYTLNTQMSYQINNKLLMQVAVENITDNFYIPFASGLAAPGFNFMTTLRLSI